VNLKVMFAKFSYLLVTQSTHYRKKQVTIVH